MEIRRSLRGTISTFIPRLLLGLVVLAVVACSWYEPSQSTANEQVDAICRRAQIVYG